MINTLIMLVCKMFIMTHELKTEMIFVLMQAKPHIAGTLLGQIIAPDEQTLHSPKKDGREN